MIQFNNEQTIQNVYDTIEERADTIKKRASSTQARTLIVSSAVCLLLQLSNTIFLLFSFKTCLQP